MPTFLGRCPPGQVTVPDEIAPQVGRSEQAPAFGGRKYDYIVNRDEHTWWPNPDTGQGYWGRWGQQVTVDPLNRRSGSPIARGCF